GGAVSFFAVLDISQSGAIQVQGKGTDGSGGNATLEAHRALTLNDIDATGDVFFGGEIDATAWCALTLPLGGTLDSTDGGINTLASGGTMAIGGTLRAIGGSDALQVPHTPPPNTRPVTPAPPPTPEAATQPRPLRGLRRWQGRPRRAVRRRQSGQRRRLRQQLHLPGLRQRRQRSGRGVRRRQHDPG